MKRIAATLMLLLGTLVITASSAQSATLPAIPGVPDCKTAPTAQMPGQGTSGFLDPAPNPLPPAGDPFAKNPTTSIYEQYGYAGLRWNTYDVGSIPLCFDVDAAQDTTWGNMALGAATDGIALANGLHNKIANPASYMKPLDDLVITLSAKVRDVIWTPWSAVALLIIVVGLLWKSASGSLSSVMDGAAWAVLVVVLLEGVMQYPAWVSSSFDNVVSNTMSSVDAGAAGLAKAPGAANPSTARGGLLVDGLLYDAWLRGEFGDSNNALAKTYGSRLFKAQAYSWAEAKAAQSDPAKARALADQKAADWTAVAQEIRSRGNGITNIQGRQGSRVSIGLMTTFGVLCTTAFAIVSDLFQFAAQVMLRFLVMFAPAIGVAALLVRKVGHRVRNLVAASVVNVIAFGAGSAIHITIVATLLSGSRLGGTNLMILVLCGVTTVVAFVLLRDLLTFNNLLGFAPKENFARVVNAVRKAKDAGGNLVSTAATVGATAYGGPAAGAAVSGALDARRGGKAEAFSRPEPEQPRRDAPAYEPRYDEARPIPIQPRSAPRRVYDPATQASVLVNANGEKTEDVG